MNTASLYRQIRDMIAAKQFEALRTLEIIKPQQFNWVAEVFENIHVKDTPDAHALIWTDGVQTKTFSFRELSLHCNRFLHCLRKHQLQQQDVIFSQMPLVPENWLTVLVSIKGGFRLIPAATILNVHDIVYRFGKLMPKAVVADIDNAIKIDEAEVLSGEFVSLKILVNGTRDGWISFKEIYTEEAVADAAPTYANDALFLFFTSGTTNAKSCNAYSFQLPVWSLDHCIMDWFTAGRYTL